MVSPERRKQDIINVIEENPTEITIKLSTRKIVDGTWSIDDISKTLNVRIFQQRNSEISSISDTKGTADTSKKYGMLADHMADLKDASNEKIEFDSPYGRMEIVAVYPQIVKGEICGYQCELKRVS
jgi:hypothetical protein